MHRFASIAEARHRAAWVRISVNVTERFANT